MFCQTLKLTNAYPWKYNKQVVLKRPGLDAFLREASKRFNLCVYSAGTNEYVHSVLNALDPTGTLILARLSREHCIHIDGMGMTKDLRRVWADGDLNRIVLVDDTMQNFYLQACNGIPVRPFINNANDELLVTFLPNFLDALNRFQGFRDSFPNLPNS